MSDDLDETASPAPQGQKHDSSSEELRQLKEMGTDLTALVGSLKQVSDTMAEEENPVRKRVLRRVREDRSLRQDLTARLRRIR